MAFNHYSSQRAWLVIRKLEWERDGVEEAGVLGIVAESLFSLVEVGWD